MRQRDRVVPPQRIFREHPWVGWALFGTHVLALELALWLGFATRWALMAWLPRSVNSEQLFSLARVVPLLPVLQMLRRMYPGYGMSPVIRLREESYGTLFFFGMVALWDYMVFKGHWSRGALLITAGYALVLVPLAEALVRQGLIRFGVWGRPVIILGAARTGALVARILQQNPALGLVPVLFFDDDPRKQNMRVEGIPVQGPLEAAANWKNRGIKTVILAMPGVKAVRLREILQNLSFPQAILVPDLLGLESLWVKARDLGGILGLEIPNNLLLSRNRLLKRALDYLLGVPLFLLSLPLIAIFALWIKMVNPGPVFFCQEREGYRGKTIRVWKLRTMYPDAEARLQQYLAENPAAQEEWKRFFKLRHDPRVLPGVGKFLRRTSLDELPQLWNILKGEMSLVGPRPFPHYHLEHFDPEFRRLRAELLPGLTGLWQVSARSEGDLEVQEMLDTYYIRNWSIWLDVYILARTVWAVLTQKGAY